MESRFIKEFQSYCSSFTSVTAVPEIRDNPIPEYTIDQSVLTNMPSNDFIKYAKKTNCNNNNNTIVGSPTGRSNMIHKKVMDEKKCESVDQETLFTGKVLQLTKFHFKDASGRDRYWEGVEKVNKDRHAGLSQTRDEDSSLVTIPILHRQIMCDCLILVKQFRAQLKSYTLEFPASIMEMNKNPRDVANKEIEDDTGYTSTVIQHISPPTSLDPVISSTKVSLVSVMIDGDDPLQNTNPRNSELDTESPDHGRIVEVLQVPTNGLLDRLRSFHKEGIIVDSLVYAFAIGLKMGEKSALVTQVNEQTET